MDPAPVAIFDGQVASAVARWKVTSEPLASTERRFANSGPGPNGSRMRRIRSKDRSTAAAVRGFPLENVRPSRSSHRYVVSAAEVKAQDSAASGFGVGDPGSKVSRF